MSTKTSVTTHYFQLKDKTTHYFGTAFHFPSLPPSGPPCVFSRQNIILEQHSISLPPSPLRALHFSFPTSISQAKHYFGTAFHFELLSAPDVCPKQRRIWERRSVSLPSPLRALCLSFPASHSQATLYFGTAFHFELLAAPDVLCPRQIIILEPPPTLNGYPYRTFPSSPGMNQASCPSLLFPFSVPSPSGPSLLHSTRLAVPTSKFQLLT